MAGLLAAPSLHRKGTRRFVRDRLLRLGIPFAAFTLILWPLLMYALYHPLGEAPGSCWEEFLSDEGYLDAGPLWFVGVLLIFSLLYAAFHAVGQSYSRRRRRPPWGRTLRNERGQENGPERGPRFRHLLMLAAESSGNQVLQELLQSIRSLLRIWVDRALTDEGHAAAALKEHREIFAALEARDAEAVAKTMSSHMRTASRRLLAGFDASQ